MTHTSAFDLWQQGISIPSFLANFDNSVEKIYNKAMQLAATNLDEACDYLLKNAKDTAERTKTIETLEKLASKKRRMPGIMQLALTALPIFNQGRAAKEDFWGRLASEEIVGFGFAAPRNPNDQPCKIPDDVWDGKVDWSNSSVSGAGLTFVSVRLVENTTLATTQALKITDATRGDISPAPFVSLKAGRKSRKDEILTAYRTLKGDGIVTLDTPKAILGHKIREFIFKDIPKAERRETGLSDETIRRIVRSTK